MKAILRSGFLALVIMALAVSANAGPFEDGQAAYSRGDYATAMRMWRPLAEQGHVAAQHNLGFLYGTGRGVPQDDAEAWRNSFRACVGFCGGQFGDQPHIAGDTFAQRLTAVMLMTEIGGTDESNSPKRVSGAGHHGTGGSGECRTV